MYQPNLRYNENSNRNFAYHSYFFSFSSGCLPGKRFTKPGIGLGDMKNPISLSGWPMTSTLNRWDATEVNPLIPQISIGWLQKD